MHYVCLLVKLAAARRSASLLRVPSRAAPSSLVLLTGPGAQPAEDPYQCAAPLRSRWKSRSSEKLSGAASLSVERVMTWLSIRRRRLRLRGALRRGLRLAVAVRAIWSTILFRDRPSLRISLAMASNGIGLLLGPLIAGTLTGTLGVGAVLLVGAGSSRSPGPLPPHIIIEQQRSAWSKASVPPWLRFRLRNAESLGRGA
jgi:hypothetical protein